ncbi:MAG: methyltransferase domain-containing protein [Polyangiaceae bacterium]
MVSSKLPRTAAAALAVALLAGCPAEPPRPVDTKMPEAAAPTAPQTVAEPVPTATAAVTAEAAAAAPSGTADASIKPMERVPDIEYVPTPENVVDKMLEAAKIGKDDVLYDLGCGDGRIVVAAAKRYGIKAKGFDIDPERVKESRANVEKNKVGHLVTIEQKDIFTLDLTPASVVTLYLLPELNVRLIPQLDKLKPGSRIVSHDFDMKGAEPEKSWTVMAKDHRTPANREHYVYLWTAPLKKTKKK